MNDKKEPAAVWEVDEKILTAEQKYFAPPSPLAWGLSNLYMVSHSSLVPW